MNMHLILLFLLTLLVAITTQKPTNTPSKVKIIVPDLKNSDPDSPPKFANLKLNFLSRLFTQDNMLLMRRLLFYVSKVSNLITNYMSKQPADHREQRMVIPLRTTQTKPVIITPVPPPKVAGTIDRSQSQNVIFDSPSTGVKTTAKFWNVVSELGERVPDQGPGLMESLYPDLVEELVPFSLASAGIELMERSRETDDVRKLDEAFQKEKASADLARGIDARLVEKNSDDLRNLIKILQAR